MRTEQLARGLSTVTGQTSIPLYERIIALNAVLSLVSH